MHLPFEPISFISFTTRVYKFRSRVSYHFNIGLRIFCRLATQRHLCHASCCPWTGPCTFCQNKFLILLRRASCSTSTVLCSYCHRHNSGFHSPLSYLGQKFLESWYCRSGCAPGYILHASNHLSSTRYRESRHPLNHRKEFHDRKFCSNWSCRWTSCRLYKPEHPFPGIYPFAMSRHN